MFTRSTTPRPVVLRVKSLIAAGLLALSLMLGVAGSATMVSAQPPKQQPQVKCEYFTQKETIEYYGFDPGPGSHWECYFWYDVPVPNR